MSDQEVLTANERFYAAIQSGDLDLMEEIWVKDKSAKCVHPGWQMIVGWEVIRESWKKIFESGGPIDVSVSDATVEVEGDVAWVICIENISHVAGDTVQTGYAQTTNIFERRGSEWLLSLHHASPVPPPRGKQTSQTLQ